MRLDHRNIDLKRISPDFVLKHGSRSSIFFDPEDTDRKRLIKIFHPDENAIDLVYSEYECGRITDAKGIRRALSAFSTGSQYGVQVEFVPGVTFHEYFGGKRLNALQFLQVAIPLARVLSALHHAGWYHHNLNPENILMQPDKGPVLIGLSRASNIPLRASLDFRDDLRSMAYIAPEQTGRMNVPVSILSDIYALGVVFYELLTGKPPFVAESKLDLLYTLFTGAPPPPSKIVEDLPAALDLILLKLLEKNPADRYQDVEHVLRDLETSLSELRGKGNIVAALPSAATPGGQNFRIPATLYGRTREIDGLHRAYRRIASGATEVIMVQSTAGVGKTSLVMELQGFVDKEKGFFVKGKFEQLQGNIPNPALNQAVATLLDRLMLEEDRKYNEWKSLFHDSLAEYGAGLAEVLPGITNFVELSDRDKESSGTEALNRVNYAYKELIRILADLEHPLVIFLDDMQWADSGSAEFLEWLLSNRDIRYLLLVFSFRPEEVHTHHPFSVLMRNLDKGDMPAQHIVLRELGQTDVEDMLGDIFGDAAPFLPGLLELVWKKTSGNPFFLHQLLTAMHNRGIVAFEVDNRRWTCDLQRLQQLQLTDDVLDLLAYSIGRLDGDSADVLRMSACIGTRFSLKQLSEISSLPQSKVLDILHILVDKGFLEKRQYEYLFIHDRIQKAAYDTLGQEEKVRIHKQIGLGLLQSAAKYDRDGLLFSIAHHFNHAEGDLEDPDLKTELIDIHLDAAWKAKSSNAFGSAAEYLDRAVNLMEADVWQTDYDRALKLHTRSTEVAFLRADYSTMETHVEQVLRHSRSAMDKMPVYEIKIMALRAQSRLLESVELVEEALSLLRVEFPEKPGIWHVLREVVRVEWLMRGKTQEDFMNLPRMEDKSALTVMRILSRHDSTVYIVNQKLMPLVLIKQLELTLKHGRAPVSPSAFVAYGVIWLAGFGRIDRGHSLARLSMDMAKLPDSRVFRSRVTYASMGLVFPFKQHLKTTIQPAFQAHVYGLEDGDFEHATFAAFVCISHQYHSGDLLPHVLGEITNFLKILRPLKQEIPLNLLSIYHQYVLNLMGRSGDPREIEGTAFSAESARPYFEDTKDMLSIVLLEMVGAAMHFYLGQPESALESMIKCHKYWDTFRSTFTGAIYMFHRALYAAAVCGIGDVSHTRRKSLQYIRSSLRHFRKLVRHCPDNHLNKYHLLLAEKHRINGDPERARIHYDKSISTAREYGFLQEEAVACERAGRFYLEGGELVPAELYLQKGHDAYTDWGAVVVAQYLREQFPFIVKNTEVGKGRVAHVDEGSLIAAANALSGEMDLKSLLSRLMDLLKKSSGAQHGFLLQEEDNGFVVQAYFIDGGAPVFHTGTNADVSGLYSKAIVNYVGRSSKTVVLGNGEADERFGRDPHIQRRQVRSVLCIPLRHQSKLSGLIYLENNLLSRAFNSERIDLLKTLSAQMAVSLENARLYRQMEEKVQLRTQEIEKERRKSEELLMNILPEFVAAELKKEGIAKSRRYEQATVLFTDFKGFTQLSETLSPEDLVAEIDHCFRNFDQIIGRHGLEKIKTIGDAYMCAGGIPLEHQSAVRDAVLAALEIRDFMEDLRATRISEGREYFEIRIGVHTGPVVAGVVGSKKFTYDIWGDTVNTASRMESSGAVGKVNISQVTYGLIRDSFLCTPRGWIEAKNKGSLQMYWVDSIR